MPTRQEIVEAATSFIGTPFHHQGRLPGVGLDCVGLLIAVADSLGLETHDRIDYHRSPDGRLIEDLIHGGLTEIPLDEAMPGDVLVFWIRSSLPRHCGILVRVDPLEMIHAAFPNPIAHVSLDPRWQERLMAALKFPEVL